MTDDIIYCLKDEDYRAINRLSKHDSDDFARNPYAFFKRKEVEFKKEPTEDMKLGTALHTKVLQPELFESQYAIIPESIKTKRGAQWETFKEENPGKECIKMAQFAQINAMAQSLLNHYACTAIFQETPSHEREVSILSTLGGVKIKSRVDIFCSKYHLLADVKTATDASPDAFMRQASDLGYDVQAAWYTLNAEARGIKVDDFQFFVVEKEFPYTVGVYKFSRHSDFMLAGEYEAIRRIREYKLYEETKQYELFPGWSKRDPALPPWNKRLQALQR